MQLFYQEQFIEAGLDEAGRGCLAGPVFAAAVILPKNFNAKEISDSKTLSEKKRIALAEYIKKEALDYAIAAITHDEIDKINILNASFKAMHKAIDQLKHRPELLLIDGNRFSPYLGISHQCIVKGDAKFVSIAAASILAKVSRDNYMLEQHANYPQYQWDSNKGYPTLAHKKAIKEFGISPLHRKSYKMS